MYKLMKKYDKKLLAIVMVFLMIAFVIPQFSKQATPSTIPAGTMGDETVTIQEVRNARAYWEILKSGPNSGNLGVEVQDFDPQTGQPSLTPLATKLGAPAVNEIEKHPVMFVLLQKEAQKNGVTIAQRDLDAVLDEIQVHLPDGRNVLYQNLANTEYGDNVRNAVMAFLTVNASFDQALSVIKVSEPLLQNRMAKQLQEIKLNLVEFDNRDYVDKVAPPTPEQINEQFNKYGDELAGQGDPKTNPFGFGYKYPDRVKISYIGISDAEVKKTIRAGRSEYDWDVEAQKYYKKHPSDFASTQPATTQASDAMTLAATSRPSTQPTTKPFAEVRDTIVADLIRPEAAKLESQIESRITAQMREDWNAYHAAIAKAPTTGPTTGPTSAPAPASSLGVPFNSTEYLTKLGEEVQKQFKVVPTVQVLGDKFRDSKELADLPGIGKSMAMFGQQPVPFGIYAIQLAAPFIKAQSPDMPTPIQLFEPSRPLSDFTDDATYIFRITDADPAHKPADSRDVLQKVEEDIRTQAAFNLAQADAQKLVDAAKTSSLRTAAVADKKSVITPDYIRSRGPLPTDVPVTTTSSQTFIDQAFDLLSDAAMHRSTIKVIGVPRDSKAFVAQLADVRRIPIFAGQALEPQLVAQIRADLGRNLYQKWYRFDSVVDRLHFVDANKKNPSEGT